MIAGVVEKEEGARAGSEQFRDGERTAECRAEALLQVVGLHRGSAVEREGRGIEPRAVDGFGKRATQAVSAPAAETPAAAPAKAVARPQSPTAAERRPTARPISPKGP